MRIDRCVGGVQRGSSVAKLWHVLTFYGQCHPSVASVIFFWLVWSQCWWLGLMTFISAPYKMCNITDGITQQPYHIFGHSKQQKFRYDDYLAIYSFILLSYVVGVDARLGEHCDFFLFRWENLDVPPPYVCVCICCSTSRDRPRFANASSREVHPTYSIPNLFARRVYSALMRCMKIISCFQHLPDDGASREFTQCGQIDLS